MFDIMYTMIFIDRSDQWDRSLRFYDNLASQQLIDRTDKRDRSLVQ